MRVVDVIEPAEGSLGQIQRAFCRSAAVGSSPRPIHWACQSWGFSRAIDHCCVGLQGHGLEFLSQTRTFQK